VSRGGVSRVQGILRRELLILGTGRRT
jgi:hypothetical protein